MQLIANALQKFKQTKTIEPVKDLDNKNTPQSNKSMSLITIEDDDMPLINYRKRNS